MSDQNSRQRGIKRERDESPDSKISNEITARRNRINQNQSMEALAAYQRITATYTTEALDGTRHRLSGQPATLAFSDEAAETMQRYHRGTMVIYTAIDVPRMVDASRAPYANQVVAARQERRNRFDRSRNRRAIEPAPTEDHPACKICTGRHRTKECIDLSVDEGRSFRVVCPFHKRSHPMDECNQLHIWASDPVLVHRLLITESANVPAYATDLISWPDIVLDTDRDLPWSAEYSHRIWKLYDGTYFFDQARSAVISHRDPDPATTRRDTLAALPPQTASGNAPRFRGPRALEELAAFVTRYPGHIAREREFNRKKAEIDAENEARIAELEAEKRQLLENHGKRVDEQRRKHQEQIAELQRQYSQTEPADQPEEAGLFEESQPPAVKLDPEETSRRDERSGGQQIAPKDDSRTRELIDDSDDSSVLDPEEAERHMALLGARIRRVLNR
ncbi:hypothetical protein F4860DRAFT_524628 [Xylaria cubensis]|nr:hypothetical protein F4860DRAFT_524628 [Xylaria cubensis]